MGQPTEVPVPIQQGQVQTPEAVSPVPNAATVTSPVSAMPLIIGGLAVGALLLMKKRKGRVSGIGKMQTKDMVLLGGLGVLAYFAYQSTQVSATNPAIVQPYAPSTGVTPGTGTFIPSVPRQAGTGPDPRAATPVNRPTVIPGTGTTSASGSGLPNDLYSQGRG